MPLDLSGLVPIVEDMIMSDECAITRDAQLTGDDVWDDVTGTYVRPNPDTTEIYAGVCCVWTQNIQPRGEVQGGVLQVEVWNYLAIPLGEDVLIQPEDLVEITSSVNPNLEGKTFLVAGETTGTMDVHRTFRMNDYAAVPGA